MATTTSFWALPRRLVSPGIVAYTSSRVAFTWLGEGGLSSGKRSWRRKVRGSERNWGRDVVKSAICCQVLGAERRRCSESRVGIGGLGGSGGFLWLFEDWESQRFHTELTNYLWFYVCVLETLGIEVARVLSGASRVLWFVNWEFLCFGDCLKRWWRLVRAVRMRKWRWTMGSMLGTRPSRSKRSRGCITTARNPARFAGSSLSGNAQFSPTSSPSRLKFGFRTEGIS